MPPALQPVPVRVLDNLETALGLVNGGSDYFFDVNVVKLTEDPLAANQLPILTIGDVGQLGRYSQEDSGRVLWSDHVHWAITILGAVESQTDSARQLLRMAHDVHRAVKQDPKRGGNAHDTRWVGWEILPSAGATDARAWMQCHLEIVMRFKDTDMTVVY
jgi:hypothetical protein